MNMKMICGLMVTLVFSLGFAGTSMGAPVFDIDLYGGDTGLVQGQYDTGTSLTLSDGQSVSVNILASGFEAGNGLMGWSLRLDYGDSLTASNLAVNTTLWPMAIRPAEIGNGFLTVEGGAPFGSSGEGDDLLLFSFDLTCSGSTFPSNLTLWDFDMGGPLVDTITSGGTQLDGQFPLVLATVNTTQPSPSVPIPAAAWLLGSGFISLVAARRKRSAR